MKLETFVFDFDGTLAALRLDFTEMKLRLNALAETGFDFKPPAPFLPVLEWLAWLDGSIGKRLGPMSGFRREGLRLIAGMELEAAREGELFPFARPLLEALAQKGSKIAVITRNCEAAVRIVFPDISDYCPALFSRDHVPSPKPDPAHLVHALKSVNAEWRTTIMIGDHPIDIQTGRAAKVMTGGVCSGNSRKEDLLAAGADLVADDCPQLIELLGQKGFV